MKTIAQTGIRVGELKYVTVEAIQVGITIVWNKEKYRNVYLTNKLCEELQMYCSDNNISEEPIFVEIKRTNYYKWSCMEKPKIFSNSSWNTTGVGLPSFV